MAAEAAAHSDGVRRQRQSERLLTKREAELASGHHNVARSLLASELRILDEESAEARCGGGAADPPGPAAGGGGCPSVPLSQLV